MGYDRLANPIELGFCWWSRLVSNQRPSACEADALPLSYETGVVPSTIERSERRRRLARSALSARIRTASVEAVTAPKEICAATLESTIVVLRDGRRCRSWRADVAQLVAHHLAKVRVAGSNPVIRSRVQSHQPQRWSGRVVRQRPAKPCTRVRFPSPPPTRFPARLAQRESASLTRKRSLVQSQYRAPVSMQVRSSF